MFKVSNFKNQTILLFIIFLGFVPSPYAIDTGILALNLDRVFLGALTIASAVFFLNKKFFSVSFLHLILISYLGFSILNNFMLGDLQLMSLYTIVMLIALTMQEIKYETLSKGLKISFIGYAAWSVYGILYFYIFGPLTQLPLASLLPDFFIKDLGHAEEVANFYNIFPRISFPFGTPPVLSALGAMFFLFFLQQLDFQNKFLSKKSPLPIYGIIFSLFIILITVSKTGIAIIVCGLLVRFILSLSWRINTKLVLFSVLALIIFSYLMLLALTNIDQSPIARFIFQRLFQNSEDFDPNYVGGHLYIRILGAQHFLSLSIFNMLFGIGYLNIDGLHYHSSLLTALLETGLIGFGLFLYLLLLPILKSIDLIFNPSSLQYFHRARYIVSSSVCIIVAHIVYEMPYVQFLWIFWAFHLKEAIFISSHGKS